MKQLSIIIPIYNVEEYVHSCLDSIFRQGIDDDIFEVILVNDGTPDKSMEVIADIVETHQNILVIKQENQGLSMARNNGMAKASGEYIMFVDSDDLLIENCVPFLLNKAISSKSDLIVADFMKMNNEQIAQFSYELFKQKDGRTEEKTGKDLLVHDLNPYYCNVWRTIYRRDFLNRNNISFIPSICFEDVPFTHQCYLKANLCLKVNWFIYIYRKGHTSITNSFNLKKAKDYCIAISKTWETSNEENLNKLVKQKIQDNVFVYFSMLFYSLTSCSFISKTEKSSVLNYLKESVPDLAFKNGFKQKLVTFLFREKPSTYISLRNIYANYFQDFFWKIGDTIRNVKHD